MKALKWYTFIMLLLTEAAMIIGVLAGTEASDTTLWAIFLWAPALIYTFLLVKDKKGE